MNRIILRNIMLVGLTLVFASGCMAHKKMSNEKMMKSEGDMVMAGPGPEANVPLAMKDAFANIDKGMKMMADMEAMMKHVMMVQQEVMTQGEALFNNPEIAGATRGISCNSCHPSGATTGGEAQIPAMMGYPGWKMPIPSLIAAAGSTVLKVLNRDGILHNVPVFDEDGNTIFNFAQPGFKKESRKIYPMAASSTLSAMYMLG